MARIAENLARATDVIPSDTPRLDAEVLLAFVLDQPRSHLHAWPERELTTEQQQRFDELLRQRVEGWPIAYLTGSREFWSLDLKTTPATLVPRPETELLVETALAQIPKEADWAIADLGTGSGAIALAVASERPRCRICASDRSDAALAVAHENAHRLGLDNVVFLHGNWYAPLTGQRFALILSNPPYVAANDPYLQQGDLRFEPTGALASGADGLEDLRTIIAGAPAHLEPGGWLMVEHGFAQGAAVRALMQAAGLEQIASHSDLAGHERITLGRRPAARGA